MSKGAPMKVFAVCSALACITCVPSAAEKNDSAVPYPVPLIFETDIGNDVDDVLALGMIHALETRGECKLLAVTITKDTELAAPFTDAVNTFYGRGDVPIGVTRSGITPQAGKFLGLASKRDGDDLRYPHNLRSGKDAPHAVSILRKSLTKAADGSVVVVQVGFSTNLADLLESKADDISSSAGRVLVRRKVRLLSVMAGAFASINGKQHLEYNVIKDIPSAKKLADQWPTPIVYSGYEIGISVPYPAESIEQDYGYAKHHPLAEAYRLYNPPPHNRPTWDLTSVLYAVRPDRDYFDVSPRGQVVMEENGATNFKPDESGSHRYLKLNDTQRIRVIESLVLLSSQP